MVNSLECYQTRIKHLETKLESLKRTNRFIIIGKLLFMALFAFFIYKWLNHQDILFLIVALFDLVLFVALYRYDLTFMKRLKITQNLLNINRNEVQALNGNYSAFKAGEEFASSVHEFSFDLDLFVPGGLFQAINRTVTAEGKALLAQWMLKTDVESQEIIARQNAVAKLSELTDWRQLFGAIGKLEDLSLSHMVAHFSNAPKVSFKPWMKGVFYGLISLSIIALSGNIVGLWSYHSWLFMFLVNMLVVACYYKTTTAIYSKINGGSKIIGRYHDLLIHMKQNNNNLNDSRLQELMVVLATSDLNSLQALHDLKKLLGRFDQRANILVSILLNGFIISDVLLLMRYNKWIDAYASKLSDYERAIAEMDALISLGNFAFNHSSFIMPQLSDEVIIEATQLGHPLIDSNARVCNDFSVKGMGQFYITTGANMAGKSTFLRTVGVNMVLASCGAPVCAQSFDFTPVKLFSSMRTSDNLVNHVSYFQAELLRLKSLIELAAQGNKLFVILDEILKGTNSKDKLAGSRLFLLKMLSYNCAGIIATHDLALGELETEHPGHFFNICFEITIKDDDIIYDYLLQQGVAHNLNATWLLNRLLQ